MNGQDAMMSREQAKKYRELVEAQVQESSPELRGYGAPGIAETLPMHPGLLKEEIVKSLNHAEKTFENLSDQIQQLEAQREMVATDVSILRNALLAFPAPEPKEATQAFYPPEYARMTVLHK